MPPVRKMMGGSGHLPVLLPIVKALKKVEPGPRMWRDTPLVLEAWNPHLMRMRMSKSVEISDV